MKSIVQSNDACWVCGTTLGLHTHEIFFGSANRHKSIEYGLQVRLCGKHHNLSKYGVHHNPVLDKTLKQLGQKKFEEIYGHEKFMEVFHKSYL